MQFAAVVRQEQQTEKSLAPVNSRFGKFHRPSKREMERRSSEAQQEEAKEMAVQKSVVDDSIDPKWRAFLVKDD